MLIDDDDDDNFFHEREISDNKLANHVIIEDSAMKALEYIKLKKVGDDFKKTLDQIFIHKEGKLSKLTLKYGIF